MIFSVLISQEIFNLLLGGSTDSLLSVLKHSSCDKLQLSSSMNSTSELSPNHSESVKLQPIRISETTANQNLPSHNQSQLAKLQILPGNPIPLQCKRPFRQDVLLESEATVLDGESPFSTCGWSISDNLDPTACNKPKSPRSTYRESKGNILRKTCALTSTTPTHHKPAYRKSKICG